MFEPVEVGHSIDEDAYEKTVVESRKTLLRAQLELEQRAHFPMIVLISGIGGASKGKTVKLLNEWMDPCLIEVRSFLRPFDEGLERPPQWRFWRCLPPRGRTGIFFGNWYSQMLYVRVEGHIKEIKLDQAIDAAGRPERMLCDEGVLLFRFRFRLSKRQLKERPKALGKDPQHSWRLSPLDWKQSETYDRFVHYSECALRRTSRDHAPWYVAEGADGRYRVLTVGRILPEGLQAALTTRGRTKRRPYAVPLVSGLGNRDLLGSLGLGQYLDKDAYKKQLAAEQTRLAGLIHDKRFRQRSLAAVFEGNDTAGKGGTVCRVTDAPDPRQHHIVPIVASAEEERAQSYLWRFWRHIPARRQFTIFDRFWYGRVLVECIEGFCAPAGWLRACGEINGFEEQFDEYGIIVVRLWLAIDKQIQIERFKEREKTSYERYKITEKDWRNCNKWDQYVDAMGDTVDRTSTEVAPWTLIEVNDKRLAWVRVLRTINNAIEVAYKKDK